MFSYTVRCTFEDAAVADQWIAWLRREHLRDVCDAGAIDAVVVRMDTDDESHVAEVRYQFKDRQSFAAYESDHAPRLREEGLKHFPPDRGLRYERQTGEVVARCP
jgi:hypothetical protein